MLCKDWTVFAISTIVFAKDFIWLEMMLNVSLCISLSSVLLSFSVVFRFSSCSSVSFIEANISAATTPRLFSCSLGESCASEEDRGVCVSNAADCFGDSSSSCCSGADRLRRPLRLVENVYVWSATEHLSEVTRNNS